MNLPVFALDARLAGGVNTGDSAYWSGLIHGLGQLQPRAQFLLISNKSRPQCIPDQPNFLWVTAPALSRRWWSLVTFPLLARRYKAEASHTQYSISPLAGRNGITTIHDVSFFIGPQWFKPKDRLLLRSAVPASVKRAKAVITVSSTSRQELEQEIPAAKGKTFVTYNACPYWIRRFDHEESQAIVHHDFEIIAPYALTVGSRWPRKNMDLAVQAVESLPASMALQLAVTGKTGWGSAAGGSRTKATGYVENDQLSRLYSGASLYLAPSLHEGFGIPVLEAFRCGCPVIASSGGALPEVVADAGIIEQSWEVGDWSRAIRELLGDSSKIRTLRELGFQRDAQFSWAEMAEKTVDVYLGVARD